MKTQTIGVEIEFTGIRRKAAAKAVAEYFGTEVYHIGGTYDAEGVKDNNGREWKIMYDGSIKAQFVNPFGTTVEGDGEHKCELVTPILNYGDIETLQEVVRVIRKAGGFVNQSCGLHVHIGANGFTAKGLRNLVNLVGTRENLFYQALNVHENRKSYCRPTDTRVIAELNKQKPDSLEEVKKIWYNGRTNRANFHYDDSRYTICNLHAFFSKGTIEYRVFNSTLHAGEVKAAIQFSLAITNFAKTTTKTTYRPVSDRPLERLTSFFKRIGLVGDEFKTARHHLLKHLNGNTAERTAVA